MLHEMRPVRGTDAHKTEGLAELVCSNSFRSDDSSSNAVGQLHWEMRRLGSLIMAKGDAHQVPAGGALAVDRDGFSAAVTAALEAHPNVTIERGEIAGLPPAEWDNVIVATGPLTSPALAEGIRSLTGAGELAFFDAIAPIVHFDSVDMDTAWFQSRYDKAGPGGTGADYINCPLDRDQYEAFIDALLAAEKTEFKEWERHALFRRLPADRGDGRARPRDAALGADEAGGPDQQAQSDGEGLCRRPAAAGQCAGHAVQHDGLPDQAEIWRAGQRSSG
jgi:methylenetetrahydrofolate--tRNA-(uracil-5-)-methyltransferase